MRNFAHGHGPGPSSSIDQVQQETATHQASIGPASFCKWLPRIPSFLLHVFIMYVDVEA